MNFRPILFSTPMVRAILAGRKTQTRRVVRIPAHAGDVDFAGLRTAGADGAVRAVFCGEEFGEVRCPHGAPGDVLWVKETWRVHRSFDALSPLRVVSAMAGDARGCIDYLATPRGGDFWGRPRVSIHLPHACARLALRVKGLRVERLQDITEADAAAEGCAAGEPCVNGHDPHEPLASMEAAETAREAYCDLWGGLHGWEGPQSWAANPWVWVTDFSRVA
jgi:hypothetical protein